jgi:hypothetical protein
VQADEGQKTKPILEEIADLPERVADPDWVADEDAAPL